MTRRLIVVTPGDPEGIGPEVAWKTLRLGAFDARNVDLLFVGARVPFDRLGAPVVETSCEAIARGAIRPRAKRPFVWLIPAPETPPKRGLFVPGFQSGWAIETATKLVLDGAASAIVTGPISKERLQRGGYPYPGHTEFLAKLCDKKSVTMMLANDMLRTSLVTTHLALKDVPRALTRTELRRAILHTFDSLRDGFGIRKPRIAVAALNPHAGESGLFGNEEIRIISPELRALRAKLRGRAELIGPLPADTLFAKHRMARPRERYDAVVCMYHDQGLIPVKLLDFPNTVNITLGLPIVRTSVDHGVAFDLVGTGKADPSSFQAALRSAVAISKNFRRNHGR